MKYGQKQGMGRRWYGGGLNEVNFEHIFVNFEHLLKIYKCAATQQKVDKKKKNGQKCVSLQCDREQQLLTSNKQRMNLRNAEDIVAALDVMLHETGLSYRALAEKMDVSPQTVLNMAKSGSVNATTLIKAAAACGWTLKLSKLLLW